MVALSSTPYVILGLKTLRSLGVTLSGVHHSFPSEFAPTQVLTDLDVQESISHVFDADSSLSHSQRTAVDRLRATAAERITRAAEASADTFVTIPQSQLHVSQESDSTSCYVRQFPVNPAYTSFITDQVNLWLRNGKIRPWDDAIDGPHQRYNTPLHPVPTFATDSEGRTVVKSVRVVFASPPAFNRSIITDRYPIPTIRTLLQRAAGCSRFSEFDLTSAFLQFPVAVDDQHKLAFTWGQKVYCFKGAIFGLSHVSSHVQRVMERTFADMPFVHIYVDNIVIASSSLEAEEHERHVLAVIARCAELNITLNPAKSKIGHTALRCLGNVLTSKGIATDPEKVRAILDWGTPKTRSQLISLLLQFPS